MLTDVNKLGERTTLGAQLDAIAPTMRVQSGHGARFAVPAGGRYHATIRSGTSREVVRVEGQAGDVLTILRAQDGTTAQAWGVGSCVEIEPTGTNFCEAVKLCAGATEQINLTPGEVCLSNCTCLTLTADGRISNVETAGC